jgi:uncharacterized protein (DUF427 family)
MGPSSIPPLGEGKESVWDYPRPPRLEPISERLRVLFAGEVIADTTAAFRVLETTTRRSTTFRLPTSRSSS